MKHTADKIFYFTEATVDSYAEVYEEKVNNVTEDDPKYTGLKKYGAMRLRTLQEMKELFSLGFTRVKVMVRDETH